MVRFDRMRLFAPRFRGTLSVECVPDDWVDRIDGRVSHGFLVSGNRHRANYRFCRIGTEAVAIHAEGILTAITVGLNVVELRRQGEREIAYEVRFQQWHRYAMIGMLCLLLLALGGSVLMTLFTRAETPAWRGWEYWVGVVFLAVGGIFALTEYHKKPAARCLERILHQTIAADPVGRVDAT